MKKIVLFLFVLLAGGQIYGQTLNQAANWPNASWTLTGVYNAPNIVAEPTDGISSTFSFDDDIDSGTGDDVINVESPVIDLTAAHSAGETLLSVTTAGYSFNLFGTGESLNVEYFDADASSWVVWYSIPDNATSLNYLDCNVSALTSSELDISGFTATQLSGFQYRIAYDDNQGWQYGFCVQSPTITSAAPPSCADPVAGNEMVVSNCATTGDYSITFDITDLSGSSQITVTNDGGGTNPAAVTTPTNGVTITGIPSGTGNVTVTLTPDDPVCAITLNVTVPACPPANDLCADATPITISSASTCPGTVSFTTEGATETVTPSCDLGGDLEVWYTFTSPGTELVFESGAGSPGIEIYDACGGTAVGNCLNNTSGTITGLTAGATYIALVWTDGAVGASGDFCLFENTCTEPTFTLSDGGNNCPADEFFIDVDITDLGSATTVNITNDGGAADSLGVDGTANPYSIGPFAGGTTVTVTVTDAADAGCFADDTFTVASACPPANDLCMDAMPIDITGLNAGNSPMCLPTMSTVGSTETTLVEGCPGGTVGPGVWFTIVGDGATLTFDVDPTLTWDGEVNVYTGDCMNGLTCVDGSDTPETISWLSTVGTTYYIYLSSWIDEGTDAGDYDACVSSDAVDCASSTLAASAVATDASCAGDTDGTVTVTATGGTTPYTSYDDGTTTNTDGMFTGLAAGVYTITVTDTDGCTATAEATVGEPTALSGSASTTGETCAGNDGTATVSASGGTAPYSYDDGTNTNTDGMFTGLAAGMYTITITDDNSCTAEVMATVADDCTAAPCPDDYAGGGMAGSEPVLTGNVSDDATTDYETPGEIISEQVVDVATDYDSGTSIELLPGFEVMIGVVFDAFIDDENCNDGAGGNQ